MFGVALFIANALAAVMNLLEYKHLGETGDLVMGITNAIVAIGCLIALIIG